MGANQPVVQIIRACPPAADRAAEHWRPGGSTPAENWQVFDFDDSAIEYMDFLCVLTHMYSGRGLTCVLPMMASSASSNVMRMGVAIRANVPGSDDLDVSHTYSFTDVDITAGTLGQIVEGEIVLPDGSAMDNWAKGQTGMIRIRRNATHANDTMSGDAELLGDPIIRES